MIIGQDRAVEQFTTAWERRTLHHGWLLAGPRGVGKASFARAAATRILAESAGPPIASGGLETPADHPIARLVEAGSHPDMRWLQRLENPKSGALARSITVEQVRGLGELFNATPFLSPWRVAVIDSVDDLEKGGANALLKMLEEPPANCLILLVSHAPGRLLATIRSRCRRLDLARLPEDAMTSFLEQALPSSSAAERARLAAMADGSPGRALAFAALDLVPLEQSATAILGDGDPGNARRASLAAELGKKTAADRYAAFLDLVPSLVAREARALSGAARQRALDAYASARELAVLAPRHSLDPSATVFQLGSILASVQSPRLG